MGDWPLIGVRFALYLTLASLFGLSAFSLYGLRAGERGGAIALRPWLVASAALGLLLSLAWVVLMAAAMAGTPVWPVDRTAVAGLLAGSPIGAAWKLRMGALVLAALSATIAAGPGVWLGGVALCSAVALGTLAWTGHGAMDAGATGWAHLAADVLHLIASAAWVGALLGLTLLVARPAARADAAHLGLTHRALRRFGTVGTIIVGTIIITGLVNAWVLVGVGHVATLATTLYGRLLLVKLGLFVAMLGFASSNRFRLTPALQRSIAADDHQRALGALRGSLAIETACVVAVLGLVAWLGTLAPPA